MQWRPRNRRPYHQWRDKIVKFCSGENWMKRAENGKEWRLASSVFTSDHYSKAVAQQWVTEAKNGDDDDMHIHTMHLYIQFMFFVNILTYLWSSSGLIDNYKHKIIVLCVILILFRPVCVCALACVHACACTGVNDNIIQTINLSKCLQNNKQCCIYLIQLGKTFLSVIHIYGNTINSILIVHILLISFVRGH